MGGKDGEKGRQEQLDEKDNFIFTMGREIYGLVHRLNVSRSRSGYADTINLCTTAPFTVLVITMATGGTVLQEKPRRNAMI